MGLYSFFFFSHVLQLKVMSFELWMHAESLKSAREARSVLGNRHPELERDRHKLMLNCSPLRQADHWFLSQNGPRTTFMA